MWQELSSIVKIHLVVNVSRIQRYIGQVEGQRKEQLAPVIIVKEEKWEVGRILNKQQIREKNKYLVQWKGFTAESDTWEGKENLGNAKEVVKEFEKEYQWDIENVRRQERKKEMFKRGKLPERFIARKLFGWIDKQYNEEYWTRLERNWRWWKERRARGEGTMETIKEEKEEMDRRRWQWNGEYLWPLLWVVKILRIRNLKREVVL